MARGARGAPKDGGNFQGSRQKRRGNLSPNAHASKASLRPAMFSTMFTPVKLTSKNGKVSDEFWLESKRTCSCCGTCGTRKPFSHAPLYGIEGFRTEEIEVNTTYASSWGCEIEFFTPIVGFVYKA